jgi:hypothetical protein
VGACETQSKIMTHVRRERIFIVYAHMSKQVTD